MFVSNLQLCLAAAWNNPQCQIWNSKLRNIDESNQWSDWSIGNADENSQKRFDTVAKLKITLIMLVNNGDNSVGDGMKQRWMKISNQVSLTNQADSSIDDTRGNIHHHYSDAEINVDK